MRKLVQPLYFIGVYCQRMTAVNSEKENITKINIKHKKIIAVLMTIFSCPFF